MLSIDGNFSDAGCFKFPTIHYHSVHGLVLFVLRESHLAPVVGRLDTAILWINIIAI